jgi:hypothetical protein
MDEKYFVNTLLERVDQGKMSRRSFIHSAGGILGLVGAYSALGNIGLPGFKILGWQTHPWPVPRRICNPEHLQFLLKNFPVQLFYFPGRDLGIQCT